MVCIEEKTINRSAHLVQRIDKLFILEPRIS